MSDLWARILAQKASLLRDLEPRHMLNDLLQHGVLDDDEHERVKRAGVTRKDRTEALLDILKGKEVEELAAFMNQLERLYPHLADQIRTAENEKVEKVIPTPRNCRVQSSTRDSLTVAWDQLEAVPGGSVEVAIFAHNNDREPVQRREVGCDQTDVRAEGLRAGIKYNARVRVVSGELRGPHVVVQGKTKTIWSLVPLNPVMAAVVVVVLAMLPMVWMTTTGESFLFLTYKSFQSWLYNNSHLKLPCSFIGH
ncbi:Hypp3888 [Branchiostoma lanceolatum]|uniref:Hypp3888 protein n=1 Tax=Branchiostoma lanceolatum TaxID=7740 RepID=A0A8K0EZQ1_BRALA|nr:Hypp3888 [Branchiostoma lanceolatum]